MIEVSREYTFPRPGEKINLCYKHKRWRNIMPEKTAKLSMFSLILYNLTGGRIQMTDAQDPVGLFALTTTGRKSGQPRTASLIHIQSGPAYAGAATNAGRDKHPGRDSNLLSDPHVM